MNAGSGTSSTAYLIDVEFRVITRHYPALIVSAISRPDRNQGWEELADPVLPGLGKPESNS